MNKGLTDSLALRRKLLPEPERLALKPRLPAATVSSPAGGRSSADAINRQAAAVGRPGRLAMFADWDPSTYRFWGINE